MHLSLATTATSIRVVHAARCPEIGPICAERDEPPQLHDQRFEVGELRLGVAYGLWRWLGVELALPVRVNRTRVTYQRLDGTAFEPDYQGIHHRNETLSGVGDPWLLVRGEHALGPVRMTGKLGVSLPLGSTEPDPFALGDRGLAHQHIQLGAGTVAPLVVLGARLPLGPTGWSLAGHGQAQLFVAENRHGYRPGRRLSGGVAGSRQLGALALSLGLDAIDERAERWAGEIHQDGNLGRTDLLLGATASWRSGATAIGLGIKLPVYQHLDQAGDEAGQLEFPALVELSVERDINLGR